MGPAARRFGALFLLLAVAWCFPPASAAATAIELEAPAAWPTGLPLELTVLLSGAPAGEPVALEVAVDGEVVASPVLGDGEHAVELPATALGAGERMVTVRGGGVAAEAGVWVFAAWLSILPPLIAIGLAFVSKDVLVSLFVGIFSGALFLAAWNPLTAFARSIDSFIAPALADADHAAILIFSCLLGGMVGVISRNGGTRGIVERLSRYAATPRRTQLATWALGVVMFFDDYANTLIVGSTMRPLTDRLRISREKLAYIVDSTAAPVASVVPISTWIGFEIGLISAAFGQLGIEGDYNAYGALVASIAYRFYPVFALVLGFTIAFSCRDLGPMLKAERRASDKGRLVAEGDTPLALAATDALAPPAGKPLRARNALLPIATVVAVTLAGLYVTGAAAAAERAAHPSTFAWLREVFEKSNSFSALLWASLAGVLVAVGLAVGQRILTVRESMQAMVEGFRSMLLAFVVLLLAWSIGAVCEQLHTADFVVGLTHGVLSPHLVPVLVFLASAGISFATGTSWGTMAILMPLVIPVVHGLATGEGHAVGSTAYTTFLLGTISSVLAGSVWGDHCSPISDTTILSSMASGCDHLAHVRTQLPYALAIGVLGMLVGDLPTAYGLPAWVSLLVGSTLIVAGVLWLGRRSDWRGLPAATDRRSGASS